jgi:Cu/Ag efflux protein CusF
MKVLATVLLFLFSILQSWAQTSVTVPVVDKSEPGSPLQITGNITFTDQITGNSISSSSDYELKAQNISGKGIIFLLVHFIEMGPREGGIGHHIQWDNFFRNEEITPGPVFILDRSSGGRQIGSFNPLGPSRDPVAEVRVLYAEFSDGSVYGERREAKDILAARPLIIPVLQSLDRANDDRSFLQTLAQKLEPEEVDGFLEGVRSAQKNRGTGAAHRLVHTELANAEKHLAVMRSAAPLQKRVLKRYEMSGLVTAVRPESKKISVYNEDIPAFLTPREMDYEVRDQTTLSNIKVGDTIHATLLSDNEEVWELENPVVTGRP